MRRVTIDGRVAGYVRDDAQGRSIADKLVGETMRESAASEPVQTIPQGARRLDLDQQVRAAGRSYR